MQRRRCEELCPYNSYRTEEVMQHCSEAEQTKASLKED